MRKQLINKAIRPNKLNDGTIIWEVVSRREGEPYIVTEYPTKQSARMKYNSLVIKRTEKRFYIGKSLNYYTNRMNKICVENSSELPANITGLTTTFARTKREAIKRII